jgi:MFS family permease
MRWQARVTALGAPHRLYYGWVLIATLGLTTIISYGATYYLFSVLVVPVSRELGASRTSLSGAYALGTILAGVIGVPVGRLVDRRGARLLMATGSALIGAMLLALARVQTVWQFYAVWAPGFAVGTALTFYPVSFTVVANWFERRRGAALATLTLLGGLASPVFIPLAGVLIQRFGWREALLLLALAQFGIALPLHGLIVRRHPEDLGLRPDGEAAPRGPAARRSGDVPVTAPVAPASAAAHLAPAHGETLRAALRGRAFWLLTTAYALATLATAIPLVHGVAYLIARGYDAVLAAGVLGAVGLASLPGRVLLNLLGDRVGPQPLLGLCLGAEAAGILLLLHGVSLGWLVAYVVVYGAAFGALSPLRAAVMAEHFGRRAYGAITAAQGVPVALCAGLGPVAAGWLYDRLGSYAPAFWLSIGAFLLAGLGVALAPRPRTPAIASPRLRVR